MDHDEAGPSPSLLPPALISGVAGLTLLLSLAGIVVMAIDSESAGVQATMIAAFPIGFALTLFLMVWVAHFFFKRSSSVVRLGVPVGCGCGAGLFSVLLAVVFFAAIFPAL